MFKDSITILLCCVVSFSLNAADKKADTFLTDIGNGMHGCFKKLAYYSASQNVTLLDVPPFSEMYEDKCARKLSDAINGCAQHAKCSEKVNQRGVELYYVDERGDKFDNFSKLHLTKISQNNGKTQTRFEVAKDLADSCLFTMDENGGSNKFRLKNFIPNKSLSDKKTYLSYTTCTFDMTNKDKPLLDCTTEYREGFRTSNL